MVRLVRLGALVMVILLGVCSRPAEANLWDWMEELSGPGPFLSRGNVTTTILCSSPKPGSVSTRLFRLPGVDEPGETCFFFDLRRFRAEESARFYRVDAYVVEFGPSIQLHPAVELGAGVGFVHFTSIAPSATSDVTATRLTISFPRLVFMPLLAVKSWRGRHNNLGFFKIYMRETIIAGDLSVGNPGQADSFAAKPGTVFSAKQDRVASMGFLIDATAVFRLIQEGR